MDVDASYDSQGPIVSSRCCQNMHIRQYLTDAYVARYGLIRCALLLEPKQAQF